MGAFDNVDFFTDASLIDDPHPYYEYLRTQGPVAALPRENVVAVTGYEEGLAVLRDDERFSAVQAVSGPIPPLPFKADAHDITKQLAEHRSSMPFAAFLATLDPPAHDRLKSLLMGVITPRRMQDNQAFMWQLADQTIDEFFDRGAFEVVSEYGRPYATLVIADLLGVPEADYQAFRSVLGHTPGIINGGAPASHNPLEKIGHYFYQYIEDRRKAPRADVLTQLAQARYPDGVLPSTIEVVNLATFLFGAGQDTVVRMFAALLRYLSDYPELQNRLRHDRGLIPEFVEEVLRLEGSVKTAYRLAKVPVKVGDLDIPPGTTIMLAIGAMNRDPRRFDQPYDIQLGRKNGREQIAFSRGIHACPGAPLARAEARITLERLFDRCDDIQVNVARHGPREARRYKFQPTYLMRGLEELHVEFCPKA
jgi:cytochrome P450